MEDTTNFGPIRVTQWATKVGMTAAPHVIKERQS